VLPETRDLFKQAPDGVLWLINNSYRVELHLPERLDKPRGWKLELDLKGRVDKLMRLTYPRRLAPCEDGTAADF